MGLELLALQGIMSKHLITSFPLRPVEDLGLSEMLLEVLRENGVFGLGDDDRYALFNLKLSNNTPSWLTSYPRVVYWIRKGFNVDAIIGDFVGAFGVDVYDAKGILLSSLNSLYAITMDEAKKETIRPILREYFAYMCEIIEAVAKQVTDSLVGDSASEDGNDEDEASGENEGEEDDAEGNAEDGLDGENE